MNPRFSIVSNEDMYSKVSSALEMYNADEQQQMGEYRQKIMDLEDEIERMKGENGELRENINQIKEQSMQRITERYKT